MTILFAAELAVIRLIDFNGDRAVRLCVLLQVFDFLMRNEVFGELNPEHALVDLSECSFDLVKSPATDNGQNGKS